MYLTKEVRAQLTEASNKKSFEALDQKLNLILERLELTNTTMLTEDTQDDIAVEVDGETIVDTTEVENDDAVEVNDTVEENPAVEIGPAHGITQMLMDAIKDEYNTIQFYNNVIATASDEGEFEDVIRILNHINEEEQIHVGMLQQLLTRYDTASQDVYTGRDEAVDILADEDLTTTDTAIEA